MPITRSHLERIAALKRSVSSVIIGKSGAVNLVVTALLARGHVLIEDNPGIGKTALARALARSVDCGFKRIQFTPDLLPSDLTGISIFDPERREFVFKPGPVFTNVLLADEINRATPRTQAALLEAMGEGRVSVDGTTRELPRPFVVIATSNPLEFVGTYPLPEAQLDRFLLVVRLGYPSAEEEQEILVSRRRGDPIDALAPAVTAAEVVELAGAVEDVRIDGKITAYVVEIARRTRADKSFVAGVSPRGTIALSRAAQAYAMVLGRSFVTPDDVKALAPHVLAHRIVERRSRASSDGRATIQQALGRILEETPVPG